MKIAKKETAIHHNKKNNKIMEQQNHSPISILVTLCTTILSWLTFYNAQYFMSFILTCIGIVSGIFAIRYYYYAGNEKRNKLKNNKKH
jgi:purine-cytosine permease-like protein